MKKILAAVLIAAAALSAAWYFLATTPGVRATLGFVSDRLDSPVEWGSVRSTGFGRFEAGGLRAVFSEVVATAETSDNSARLRALPAAFQFDSRLRGIRLAPTRAALGGRELVFAEGSILATLHASGASEYVFTKWTSPELSVEGEVEMNDEGKPVRAQLSGRADLALLGAMFLKKDLKEGVSAAVPFEIDLDSGTLEVRVSGKPWLRSRWTMRQ